MAKEKKNTKSTSKVFDRATAKRIETEMWYAYRAAYRAESSGGNYTRLHKKIIKMTEKLIDAADSVIDRLNSQTIFDAEDLRNISDAVLNISKARALQSGCLTGSDVMRYVLDAKHMEAVKEGKAALADAENTGVVILPVINNAETNN